MFLYCAINDYFPAAGSLVLSGTHTYEPARYLRDSAFHNGRVGRAGLSARHRWHDPRTINHRKGRPSAGAAGIGQGAVLQGTATLSPPDERLRSQGAEP